MRFCTGLAAATLWVAGSFGTSVLADDIDVFKGGSGQAGKPNIMMVFDLSNSMNLDIYGNDAGSSGYDSRLDILKSAVSTFLDQNVDTARVGYLYYTWAASGVRFPVADLSASAHLVDPAIPDAPDLRVVDIIRADLMAMAARSKTNTVAALVEAALYFGGGPVALGGINKQEPAYWKPNTWSTENNRYQGGNFFAANPAAYTPGDAYQVGVEGDGEGWCRDFTVGGTIPDKVNNCPTDVTMLSCTYDPGFTETSEGGEWVVEENNLCSYRYPDHWAGANYISPIDNECSNNVILLISDGVPEGGWGYPEKTDYLGTGVSACEDLSSTLFAGTAQPESGNCGLEVAAKLYQNDQIASIPGSNVRLYTVGFNTSSAGSTYLERLAEAGGGEYHQASDLVSLSTALTSIASSIKADNQSFVPISVDVNRASFSHDSRAYINVFKPESGSTWKGNLKGYFLDDGQLVDVNGMAAIVNDGQVFRFSDSAQSFWSSEPDGAIVEKGGASGALVPGSRNLLTYTGASLPPGGEALIQSGDPHTFSVDNFALSVSLLGIDDVPEARETVIDRLRNAPMGDALHSRSVPVNYANETIVYTMTNQGLLHAIDATLPDSTADGSVSGGDEIFAFIPPELLPNLRFLAGLGSRDGHIYGLDGQITRWHEDENNDGIVNGGDSVLLIFGMRRGGRNYYALDVTDPRNPVYKWKISGGVAPFAELAQSWSRMSLITAKSGSSTERVLMFAGGYDPANDSSESAVAADGNSIFIIDRNGTLIWSAKHGDMRYSIPSDLTIIDSDDDRLADRAYVGDLGGNVWRVNIADVRSTAGISVERFASLGGGTAQPFFYPPSVSLESDQRGMYFSVALGSGNRAQPLISASSNRLYKLRDQIHESDFSGTPLTDSDLYDATDNQVGSSVVSTAMAARARLDEASGWYVNLDPGEKVLSKITTYEGRLMATTLKAATLTDSCGAAALESHYYSMAIDDAIPLPPFSDETGTTQSLGRADRRIRVLTDGIPTSPLAVTGAGSGDTNILVSNQIVDTIKGSLRSVYWYPIR